MKKLYLKGLKLAGVGVLMAITGACTTAGGVDENGQPRLIAQPRDTSFYDRQTLPQQQAAIAYDPDGCQNWLIDDGAEGYATRRRDPVSGLPVCNREYPPGYVVKNYKTNTFIDIVPK